MNKFYLLKSNVLFWLLKISLILFGFAFSNLSNSADTKRLALVIGNDNYQHIGKLEKAGNDAAAMARELKTAGFQVELHRDVNYRTMSRVIDAFASRINGGDQVVVFYAGHGVQIKSGNYLLPTDLEKGSENEIERFAYSLDDLTAKLSEAKASFSLVLIDACRNNPIKVAGRSIGASRGLSPVEPPKGQMVVFSASRGQEALDKLSDKDNNPNGVFTREFIARMKKPGVKIQDLMVDVQEAVENLAKTVGHEQRPALYNESRGNFYFYGNSSPQVSINANTSGSDPEAEVWNAANKSNSVAGFQAYLQAYPKGRYVLAANINIETLKNADAARINAPKENVNSNKSVLATVDSDTALWNAVEKRGRAEDYLAYLQQFSKGRFAVLARQRLKSVDQRPNPGRVYKDCMECPEMVEVPAGEFMMGGQNDENEKPVHRVLVPRFAIGKTEVTRAYFAAFVAVTGYDAGSTCLVLDGSNWKEMQGRSWKNPGYSQSDADPVVCINTEDALAYAKWLSQKTGHPYRLPTEAEWEYACRGGRGDEDYCGGAIPDSVAWYANNSGGATQKVATKKANDYSLYDMSGSVWEWTQDCWNGSYLGAPSNGSAWTTGSCFWRVHRGGSFRLGDSSLRAASRDYGFLPTSYAGPARYDDQGMRLVRALP